jgi:glyoxylase-like metal-dependent hydrolase (beta-lactamase superfamily II)
MSPPANDASRRLQVDRRGFIGLGLGFASGCGALGCGCGVAMAAPGGDVDSQQVKPPPGGKGYAVSEIGGGLYWVTDGGYNTMFAVTTDGVIACDAPPSLGANYLKAIAEVTTKPVTHLIYSHEHIDHIAGAGVFPKGIEIIANRHTANLLASRADARRLPPTRVFDDAYTLSVGGQTLQLSYRGINHCLDNTFIYAPRQRVLMLIDVIYPGWMPYKNLGVAVDVPGFVEAHGQALTFDFETLVAGHVSRLGTRKDVELQLAFLKDLSDACERAYVALTFPSFLAGHAGKSTSWDLHNAYEAALVDRVAADVGPHWRGRLQGFDTYFRDNCWAMLESFVVQGKPRFG